MKGPQETSQSRHLMPVSAQALSFLADHGFCPLQPPLASLPHSASGHITRRQDSSISQTHLHRIPAGERCVRRHGGPEGQ